jgi:hypothetical protein
MKFVLLIARLGTTTESMSSESEILRPPNTPEAFESLCLDLWKELLDDPQADKNGRRGQPQAGVDVFGEMDGRWTGIQCKQKETLLWTKVTVAELNEEVAKARNFLPKLSVFILATSGLADAAVQEGARELTDLHRQTGHFSVHVWSWQKIWKEIQDRPSLLARLVPRYWPNLHEAIAPRRNGEDRPAGAEIVNQISIGQNVIGNVVVQNYLRKQEGKE